METISTRKSVSKSSRFLDVKNEPLRHLMSIKGYRNMPLVSLKEAINPISYLFKNIEEYLWIAEENCKNPENNLTNDESASICLYTMKFSSGPSLHTLLNKQLQDEDRERIKPWFLYLKLFFTAIYKVPSSQIKVWRGAYVIDLTSKYKVGEKIVWWGFGSCTIDMEILEKEYFLNKNDLRTIFSIESFNGTNISSHSYYRNKPSEILLLPGSHFEVINISKPSSNLHIIHLKQIQPQFPLLELPISKVKSINLQKIKSFFYTDSISETDNDDKSNTTCKSTQVVVYIADSSNNHIGNTNFNNSNEDKQTNIEF